MVEAFRFQHSEVMRMPFRTFMAYGRLAAVRSRNRDLLDAFDR